MNEDINFGAMTEALNDKADRDLNNMTANIDYVVERYNDEQGNWYRVYKSGWIEQGGATAVSAGDLTVSLLKPYKDNLYSLVVTIQDPNTVGHWHARALTETSFIVYAAATSVRKWRACGQGA